jgi:hypothetical protein
MKILNYTAATGDTTYLEKISGPRCSYCEHFIDVTEQVGNRQAWTVGHDVNYRSEPSIAETKGRLCIRH